MTETDNPALAAFASLLTAELVAAQVLIQSQPRGYELRHVADKEQPADQLRLLDLAQLRAWSQVTEAGAFRPLKSAPNLARGWRFEAANLSQLGTALDVLYPGGIADWFAAHQPPPPVTNYRGFTDRQTGMYRITQALSDRSVGQVIEACCAPAFCLKHRLWTVEGHKADEGGSKSLIVCLEPCPVFLEFARTARRLEQDPKMTLTLAPAEMECLQDALAKASASDDPVEREADFSSPSNPRRRALLRVKLTAQAVNSGLERAGDSVEGHTD